MLQSGVLIWNQWYSALNFLNSDATMKSIAFVCIYSYHLWVRSNIMADWHNILMHGNKLFIQICLWWASKILLCSYFPTFYNINFQIFMPLPLKYILYIFLMVFLVKILCSNNPHSSFHSFDKSFVIAGSTSKGNRFCHYYHNLNIFI